MSGDVQPRKRKDKKRKKDELGVEEPRGTAAVLGEGDVFMHSQHEHGTGGHWCAKIIFFSLLAVLVTLIGLIILENRGLTDLEANSVESRYSGVLEGWLEDAPDDDHHDEHTLELLKQHDDDDDHEISQEDDHDQDDHEDDDDDDHNEEETDEVDHDDEDEAEGDNDEDEENYEEQEASNENQEQEEQDDDDDDDDDDEQGQQEDDISQEEGLEEADEDDDDDDEHTYESNESVEENERDDDNDDEDDDDLQTVDDNNTAEDDDVGDDDEDNLKTEEADDQSEENEQDEHSQEDDNDEEHEEHEEDEADSEIEVEKLEKEVSDEEVLSEEQRTQETEEDDKSQEVSAESPLEEVESADDADSVEDEEFLEAEDIDDPLPVVERIVAPKGKPLAEVEDEPTTEKPADTLADEEEYEKQQEELRREEAQASHVWLKLAVGGALLVATYGVVTRAVAPRDDTPASDGHSSREETPSAIDRRMTLIPGESAAAATPKEVVQEIVRPIVEEKVFEKVSPIINSAPQPPKEESEEDEVEEEEEVIIDSKAVTAAYPAVEVEDKELYSDEDEVEEVEEEEEVVEEKKVTPKQAAPVSEKVVEPEEPDAEEDVPDDVEIIDDEQLEEELEEEEDEEEEISDVDDAELLTRLEAKYGRLPEPDRPQPKNKDGGNSIEADWPGEPADKYWRQQLDEAEQELRQGDWSAATERVSAEQLKASARARWLLARAMDAAAEANRDNRLLTRAIAAYLDVLKMNEQLSDARLREVADRTLDRIRFRGNYMSAEPVYRLLIRRFPDVVDHRNNLTVSLLMANRADLAEGVIKETLKTWPNDRVALAHLGFILKTSHNRLEEAVEAFQKALDGDTGPATEPRFYYHLGDSLLLLGRFEEAHEVHKRGAKLGHFLSPSQRSLYNVDRLKSRPWWDIDQTPYVKLARALEKSWQEILKEGLAAQALYEKEKEGLKERGEWSQLDLFVRGQEVPGRCKKAPVTCAIVKAEAAAAGCRRGQVKFSSMEAGTHVRPHVGPTNCRLRMHLGLSNTKDTYIRVDKETRQWQVGKVLMFDDSFEHEVWHNGTGARLVLIVDVWHPALSPAERRALPPI